jgi:septal ring factor EnvC (AmiA/AmiB activator)
VRSWSSIAILCLGACLTASLFAQEPPAGEPERRLAEIEVEMAQLETALGDLRNQERSILGEIEQLDAELRLRESRVRESALRLEELEISIAGHDATLERLDLAQLERRRYLSFRLREIYKGGSDQLLRRLLTGDELETYFEGLGYASYLSERDALVLDDYRDDAELSAAERDLLAQDHEALAATHEELSARRDAVGDARRRQAALLEQVRGDGRRKRGALAELRQAAEDLGRLAEALAAGGSALDIREFKGLLDWPTEGEVTAGFGKVVHPEFKTEVPHPGWDISADFGSDVSAVFDGNVLFADWMRGYGLTAIIDHGGALSIYAHASVLLVEQGEAVGRGQLLGKVGETGSLRGSFLYFELRVDGEPVDPADWLRRQ